MKLKEESEALEQADLVVKLFEKLAPPRLVKSTEAVGRLGITHNTQNFLSMSRKIHVYWKST